VVCEILSVGTELLLGQILNTNAQYLAVQLSLMGIDVYYQTTVGDNAARLSETLMRALSRSDAVILTGGIGPTQDDITKEVVASALGLPMEDHEPTIRRLEAFYARRGWAMTPNNLRQAAFPRGAVILENANGTAPACIVETGGKAIVVLPGPPNEMQSLFETQVKPYLETKSESAIASRVLRIIGMGESSVEHAIREIIDSQTNPTVAPYATFGEVTLRITAKCRKGEDPAPLLDGTESRIRSILGEYVYAVDAPGMEHVVAGLLMRSNKRLAVAESCTGGMVASALVKVPGISAALTEGVVAYSDEAKVRRLGVRRETLEKFGAVSAETAKEMAAGLLGGADVALSVTGIAGPGGRERRQAGGPRVHGCRRQGRLRGEAVQLLGRPRADQDPDHPQRAEHAPVVSAKRRIKAGRQQEFVRGFSAVKNALYARFFCCALKFPQAEFAYANRNRARFHDACPGRYPPAAPATGDELNKKTKARRYKARLGGVFVE
jgi:nicotinamide-nucleotide amidase